LPPKEPQSGIASRKIEVAMATAPTTPKLLYKYRCLSTVNEAWVRDIIEHSLLYMPSPTEINDPFDCKVVLLTNATLDEVLARIESHLNQRPDLSPARKIEIRNVARADYLDPAKKPALMASFSDVRKTTDKWGVLSLSAIPDSPLMWSHYADGHRGFCLEFERAGIFAESLAVVYQDKYPETDAVTSTAEEQTKAILLTKASCWSYESEWRILRSGMASKTIAIAPNLFTRIILGAAISAADKAKIAGWAAGRAVPIPVTQARLANDQFRIEV
jgi:hypothetical protein